MRIRAIYKALYHGIMPYWIYEKEKHYSCTYLQHLLINITYALRWLMLQEDEQDINFELNTNKK